MTKTDKLFRDINDTAPIEEFRKWTLLELKMWARANYYGNYHGSVCDRAAERIYFTLH